MKPVTTAVESTKMTRRGSRVRRSIAVVALVLASLVSSVEARAETDGVTTIQDDSIKQLAGGALGYSVMVPDDRGRRVMLAVLGVAGMHLDRVSLPARSPRGQSAVRSLGYRVGLPLAGAALGGLVTRNRVSAGLPSTAEPMIGSLAGSFAAHVLDPPPRQWETSRDHGMISSWTATVSVMPGTVMVGISGRF